jgi:Trypsin-like peptidase domain
MLSESTMRIVLCLAGVLLTILALGIVSPCRNVRDYCVRVESSTVHWFPPSIRSQVGTGICIGENCSLVLTPYHMQLSAGRAGLEVMGGQIGKVSSAATSMDDDKSDVRLGNKIVSYNVANDFSFLYMKRNVRHKERPIARYQPNVGQPVYVAGYYGRAFQIFKTRLIGVNVPLIIGESELKENLVLDIDLKPGSSGSAVLDEHNRLLGMIVVTGKLELNAGNASRVSIALPIRSIAARLISLDPAVGSALFRNIPDAQQNETLPPAIIYEELELPQDTSPVIPVFSPVQRHVPNATYTLQQKAAAAANIMRSVIAEQCMVQGTAKAKCHEVSINRGDQAFREIRQDGKLGKQISELPPPKAGVWSASDWADTLAMVAEGSWNFEGVLGEKYLFTRRFNAEDDECEYEEHSSPIPLFGGGYGDWKGLVPCIEKVLTDQEFNLVADFWEVYPPAGRCKFRILQSAIYYNWVSVEGLKSPLLLPTSERINGKQEGREKLVYTTISWAKYRKFASEHKIRFPQTVLLRRP